MEPLSSRVDDARPEPVTGASRSPEVGRFVELRRVTLARPVEAEEGRVPAGATGTVMHVWANGSACEVEFTRPFRAIAVVKVDDIAA